MVKVHDPILGNCVRLREAQLLRDVVEGRDVRELQRGVALPPLQLVEHELHKVFAGWEVPGGCQLGAGLVVAELLHYLSNWEFP